MPRWVYAKTGPTATTPRAERTAARQVGRDRARGHAHGRGGKHPVGPLKTTDIVSLDVRLGIAEYLHQTIGDRFAPPQILRDKVAAGALGRKAGGGFYDWE